MLAAFKAAVFLQRDAGALRHFFFGKADDLAHGANALRHLCELCFQVCFFRYGGLCFICQFLHSFRFGMAISIVLVFFMQKTPSQIALRRS